MFKMNGTITLQQKEYRFTAQVHPPMYWYLHLITWFPCREGATLLLTTSLSREQIIMHSRYQMEIILPSNTVISISQDTMGSILLQTLHWFSTPPSITVT